MSIIASNSRLIGRRNANLFTITVKTDNAGTTAANEFLLPIYGDNFEVITDEEHLVGLTAPPTLSWSVAGTYEVKVKGDFDYIRFEDLNDKLKLLSVEKWGNNNWTTFADSFHGCANLTINANDVPNLSIVSSVSRMFQGCTSFNKDISNWDVSNVQNFSYLFSGAISYNQPINSWSMSNALDLSYMFQDCSSFNQNISNWDVSNVTNMSVMFINSNFNQDIGAWSTSNVTNMSYMFFNTPFNQNIAGWNVSSVKNMSNMFYASHFNQPLNNWNVSSVTNMSYMFYASHFNQPLNNWNVSSVTNMLRMFNNATYFDQDISNWDVSNVTTFNFFMFNATLSTTNYDAILTAWSQLNLPPDIVIHFGNSKYTAIGESAKNNIINDFNWTITDAGLHSLLNEDYRYAFDGVDALYSLFNHDDIPIIDLGSTSGQHLAGDAIIDLSDFGTAYDKSYYFGNSEAKSENWDYPFIYFDAANPTHWKIEELNYRLIEMQSLIELKNIYAKLNYSNGTLLGMTELFIYNNSVADETEVLNYIGLNKNSLLCESLGYMSFDNNQAYGEFIIRMNLGTTGLNSFLFVNSETSQYNSSAGDRYSITPYNSVLYLVRKNDGSNTPTVLYSGQTTALSTWYEFKVTRNSVVDEFVTGAIGTIAIYARGGAFGSSFQLLASALDNTHTTSLYGIIDIRGETIFSGIKINGTDINPDDLSTQAGIFSLIGYYNNEIGL
jgi:surface protein